MRYSHRTFLQRMRRKYGIHIVKQPMDGSFMLAVYTRDGLQIFRSVLEGPSETAYDFMYPQAGFAVARYFNVFGPSYGDNLMITSTLDFYS